MSFPFELPILDKVSGPEDLRKLSDADLDQVAKELRNEVIEVVSQTGGHLGSSLGVVELTVALHAIFKTPLDNKFPGLELLLYYLFETIKDIILFTKNLFL